MISYVEAIKKIFEHLLASRVKPVGLDEAYGYFLAENIKSNTDLPMFNNSAMDGYAARSRDIENASERSPLTLKIVGKSPAGSPFPGKISRGQAVYIATGGAVPKGADAIVPVENTSEAGSDLVKVFKSARKNDHIRFAGEEIKKGDVVLSRHDRLDPARIGFLVSAGARKINVFEKPSTAFLATGDELVEPGQEPGPGQIRNSNTLVIRHMIEKEGFAFRDLGIAGDDRHAILEKLSDTELPDVLITSAGVSVGRYDIVVETLKSVGLDIIFWKAAIRPGKPLIFGRIGKTLYFGLPGNPASAAVVYKIFVEPALLAMAGSVLPFPVVFEASAESSFKPANERLQFARGVCYYDKGWKVKSTGQQGSHIISSIAAANCLVIVPPGPEIKPGNAVKIQMLEGLRFSLDDTIRAFS
jgi:molybdopterin molybdotransferase